MHITTYSLHANTYNAPVTTAMENATPTLHSSAASALLWANSCATYESTGKMTIDTQYTSTPNHTKRIEKEFISLLHISTQGKMTTTPSQQPPPTDLSSQHDAPLPSV